MLPKRTGKRPSCSTQALTLIHTAVWLQTVPTIFPTSGKTGELGGTTEQEGEGGRGSGFEASVDCVEWGLLGILSGKEEDLLSASSMGIQAFLPLLQDRLSRWCLLSSQLLGSRPASCRRITQQPQLERRLERL